MQRPTVEGKQDEKGKFRQGINGRSKGKCRLKERFVATAAVIIAIPMVKQRHGMGTYWKSD